MSNYWILVLFLFSGVRENEGRTSQEEQSLLQESGTMLFELFTRKNPVEPWNFELNDLEYLKFSHFNASKPTIILTHGWNCYWGSAFNVLMREALLLKVDANVIVVSWDLQSKLFYFAAKRYVPTAGKVVAFMIDRLCQRVGMKIKDVHIIGHSLGAHVAGIAGLYTTSGKLPRVTGLDPAGPFFSSNDEMRLSKASADFVDVIHTAGFTLGFDSPVGHADFYPNGGTAIQPGCGWDMMTFRSHRRSYWLYGSSVLNPGAFMALKCDDWSSFKDGKCTDNETAEMGFHVSHQARGIFYLRTGSNMPYGLGNSTLEFK